MNTIKLAFIAVAVSCFASHGALDAAENYTLSTPDPHQLNDILPGALAGCETRMPSIYAYNLETQRYTDTLPDTMSTDRLIAALRHSANLDDCPSQVAPSQISETLNMSETFDLNGYLLLFIDIPSVNGDFAALWSEDVIERRNQIFSLFEAAPIDIKIWAQLSMQ